ncbi:MAG: flagellar basal body rod C-terminal domain-containing protein [Smithella sp.]
MSSVFGIALNALKAFETKLAVNANNVANMETNNFKKSRVELQEAAKGGVQVSIEKIDITGIQLDPNARTGEEQQTSNVSLEEEIIDQIVTQYSYEANILTIKTASAMQEELLNIKT